jgi:hypothetical protein
MRRDPSDTLNTLLNQHASIRDLIRACERLTDALDDGEPVEAALDHAVSRLRVALESHNDFEESILQGLLREADSFGEVRIERMVGEHLGEHRALRDALGAKDPSPRHVREALLELRDHLDEEERVFLSPRVLRDDVVSVESSS